ncbi:MAG: excinuclease ABC subunit UvrA, partial [Thermodesulfovibrionales bacterium]|nr:excinuclease ABC subunit UvrA [Thermodesulfovibrionales bacterium]
MSPKELLIEGARQNNLKNISLRIPHNKVIAITGVSGSGKSSLAFDTLFAEGQWRYIESLSTYARLFLEKMDRPDVDAIYNLRPAIALEQKNPIKSSRSTVGTLTEVYDLFRLLFSKISTPFCPKCSKEIKKWHPSMIISELLNKYKGEKIAIIFKTDERLQSLLHRGFQRILLDGEIVDINEVVDDSTLFREVVFDRLIVRDEPRLSDSIENAWKEGKENLKIQVYKNTNQNPLTLNFTSKNICDECGYTAVEPSAVLFSFNHPLCACPECNGFGNVLIYDEELIIPDKYLSLEDGAIELWELPTYKWWKQQMIKGAKRSGIDIHKPYIELSVTDRETIYKGNEHFYGVEDFFKELENKRYKLHIRVLLSRYRRAVVCPKCQGTRLCESALIYKINGVNIAELSRMPISRAIEWFKNLQLTQMQREISKEIIRQILLKLNFLEDVGLGYLSLDRQAKTLSGGEYQRVNLSNQLASALTSTLYVLDEPTIGLHPRDTLKIMQIMKKLAMIGNTIVVVEHDRDIISNSDWVVELGPDGGHLGGDIIFNGPLRDFINADTLTARYIASKPSNGLDRNTELRLGKRSISLIGACGNNLKGVSIKIPLNALTVVTGVSGSGKSSLIIETLYKAIARYFKIENEQPLPYHSIKGLENLRGVRLIDQSPIGKTPRSNPVTYLKLFDPIRKLFANQPDAKRLNLLPASFSFNIPGGRCESCKGEGYKKLEMYFFEDIYVKCEDCHGKRYRKEILQITYRGKNIYDILEMTVNEASEFFSSNPEIASKFSLLKDIGLGYLKLGQAINTLSGGESQRLKICSELEKSLNYRHSKGFLYILDEPTVGLHYRDVVMFMGI